MIYSMEIDANMRRLSVGAALSEAEYIEQHWSRSLESPLRAAVCKPEALFETSHVAVAFSSLSRLVTMVCIWCTRSLGRLSFLDLLLRHNALIGGHPGPRKKADGHSSTR